MYLLNCSILSHYVTNVLETNNKNKIFTVGEGKRLLAAWAFRDLIRLVILRALVQDLCQCLMDCFNLLNTKSTLAPILPLMLSNVIVENRGKQ